MQSKEEQVVRRFFELYGADDMNVVKEVLHPDVTWQLMGSSIPGFGKIYHGVDEIINTIVGPARTQFESVPQPILKHFIVSAPWVVTECETQGMLKNGREYRNVYCFIFEVIDGQIKNLREYMDTGTAIAHFSN